MTTHFDKGVSGRDLGQSPIQSALWLECIIDICIFVLKLKPDI